MTAIRPSESQLRDLIDADAYNTTLNEINAQYTEMDKFIGNLASDILSILDFEKAEDNAENEEDIDEGDGRSSRSLQGGKQTQHSGEQPGKQGAVPVPVPSVKMG